MGKEAMDTIYDEVVKRFDREIERTAHLDEKANNIVGFAGILTGIVSGFGALTLKFPSNATGITTLALFTVSIISLFLSFVIGLRAYFPKKFSMVPDPYVLIGKYENASQRQVIRDLCDNYAIAVEENCQINNFKTKNIKRAIWFIFIAIVVFSLFALAPSLLN